MLHSIIYSLEFFHISVSWSSSNWRLSDSKSPQGSRTLLSILAVFNNAVVWVVFTRPPTSKWCCWWLLLPLFYSLRLFYPSVDWWSFIGVWLTASSFTSPACTLLSVLAYFKYYLVWIVSIILLISNCSHFFLYIFSQLQVIWL